MMLISGFIACKSGSSTKTLPILGSRDPVTKVVDGKTEVDTVYQTIPHFSFVDQDSVIINNDSLNNKIYVADFFFTSCPSICPIMHRNMLKVYKEFKGNPQIKILSHSIDPKYDTPSVLKRYANKLGVEGTQWEFVNGPQDSVYKIASDYLVAVAKDDKAPGGYVHQGWFILVDKNKHLRGAYDGTQPDQVEKMIGDIHILLDEENNHAK